MFMGPVRPKPLQTLEGKFFTREGSQVQSLSRPPRLPPKTMAVRECPADQQNHQSKTPGQLSPTGGSRRAISTLEGTERAQTSELSAIKSVILANLIGYTLERCAMVIPAL